MTNSIIISACGVSVLYQEKTETKKKNPKTLKSLDSKFWLKYGYRLASLMNKKLPIIERYEENRDYLFHHFQVTPSYVSEWSNGMFVRRVNYKIYKK